MKQTDYDKAFYECNKESKEKFDFYNFDALHFAFRKGYEYGKEISTADHERNLIALGDDYMTARERAIKDGTAKINGKSIYEAYRQGWDDADAFDEAWLDEHPDDLKERITEHHPDLYNRLLEEAQDSQYCSKYRKNRQESTNCDIDHFADASKMMRYEIAKDAMNALIRTYGDRGHKWISENAVGYADALIKELEH